MFRILIERSVKITKQKISVFYAIHETLCMYEYRIRYTDNWNLVDLNVILDNTHPLILFLGRKVVKSLPITLSILLNITQKNCKKWITEILLKSVRYTENPFSWSQSIL